MGSLDYGIPNVAPRYTGAETKRDTSQLITHNTLTEVLPSGVVRDSDQLFSVSRLTIPQSGLWLTQALAVWQVNQFNGYRSVVIQQTLDRSKNRGVLNSEVKGPGNTLGVQHTSTAILALDPLNAGDEISMMVRETNDGAGDQNLIGGDGYTPRLVAHRFTQLDRYIGAYLYGTVSQSIAENVWTELNLTTMDFENGINWGSPSLVAKRNGVPIRTAGVYLAIVSMRWVSAGGLRGVGIYIIRADGTISIPNSCTTSAAAGAGTDLSVTAIVVCQPGDQITVRGFQLSGAAQNSTAVPAERKPNLRVLKLGEIPSSRYALGEAKLTFAQLYSSVTLGTSSGSRYRLVLDKVLYDTDSLYTTGLDFIGNYRFGYLTIRRRGMYLIAANLAVTFNAVSDNVRCSIIRSTQNFEEVIARSQSLCGGDPIENSINCVRVVELFPGDQITAEYFDPSNGRTINAADPNNLFRSSLTLVGLDSPQTQGSGRYNPGGQ